MPYVPIDQAIQQNPDFVKQNYPQIYSQYVQQVQQPGATLSQTQQSTQTSGAEQASIQAGIPGTQAESGIKQVQQQQTSALQNLNTDLKKNKMTLPDAMSKYKALNMSPDQILSQYISESPYGFPKQNIAELQNMGVSDKLLGDINNPGSIRNRSNVLGVMNELDSLNDYWNQVSGKSALENALHLPLAGADAAANYNTKKTDVMQHVLSAIPGSSAAQTSTQKQIDEMPDPMDPGGYAPGKVKGIVQTIKQTLLQQNKLNPEDIGLSSKDFSVPTEAKGGDLLTKLLGNAGNDIKSDVSGMKNMPGMFGLTSANPMDIKNNLNAILGIGKEYGDLAKDPIGHAEQHPVNTALDLLPFLSAGKAAIASKGADAGEAGIAANTSKTATLPKLNGNVIMDLINPGRVISRGGNFRDVVNKIYDKAGVQISGDQMASDIRKWADNAKMSNLPDSDAIEEAAQKAETNYKGKSFSPSKVQNIYDQIESGYTKGSTPKSAAASYIDRGVKGVLGDTLNQATEGNWKKGTSTMAKGYNIKDSGTRKFAGRATSAGLGLAGLDELRKILGVSL